MKQNQLTCKMQLAYVLVLIFSACATPEYEAYEDWDLDDDGQIDLGEYQEGVGDTGLFTDWDLDEDELITEEEFSRGAYRYWDTDGDGQIEAVEYEE
jgi:hypothetical protein